MLLDHVTARLGGRDLTLKIPRGDLPAFEAATGHSAFAMLKTIHSGAWTVRQLKAVLSFAMIDPEQLRMARMLARIPGPTNGIDTAIAVPHIERTFAERPPATYAPLAEAILGAALFGITAEEATFTDEADGA